MKNVGKRRDGPELELNLMLRGDVAAALVNAAMARGRRPIDVLADVIEAGCADDLFTAMLDDQGEGI